MILTDAQLRHLSEVIKQVETRTSGELRLVIARRSAGTGHVFPLLAFALTTLALVVMWQFRQLIFLYSSPWLLPAVLLGCTLLALILARFEFVQRTLSANEDLADQAALRAEAEFHREGLSETRDRTGILIFLSLFEHQAVVLGDKGIAAKVGNDEWSKVVGLVIEGARTGKLAEKLEEAIRLCGENLSRHFPAQAGDSNELPNHVIVKD